MNNLHKKSTTKEVKKSHELTEERVREIVKEEIAKCLAKWEFPVIRPLSKEEATQRVKDRLSK